MLEVGGRRKHKEDGRFGGLTLESLGLPLVEMRKMRVRKVGLDSRNLRLWVDVSKGRTEITTRGVSAITGVYSSGLIITLVIIGLLTPERNIFTEGTSRVLLTLRPNDLTVPSSRQTFKYLSDW